MRYLAVLGAAALAAMSGAAQAGDRTGYTAIAAGDLAAAERTLEQERRIFPNRPELMLNLAAVYARGGRATDARTLYADVLGQPQVQLDMPSGAVASSHDIARRGLARLGAPVPAIASR